MPLSDLPDEFKEDIKSDVDHAQLTKESIEKCDDRSNDNEDDEEMPDLSSQVIDSKPVNVADAEEPTEELPKAMKRCLRSISPPKLSPEANFEIDKYSPAPLSTPLNKGSFHEKITATKLLKLVSPSCEPSLGSPYRQTFRDEWLSDPELSPWIQKFPPDPTKAFCPICKITIGSKHSSLVTHSKSGGHDRCKKEVLGNLSKASDLKTYLKTSLPEYLKRTRAETMSHIGTKNIINSIIPLQDENIEPSKRSPYRQIFREEWLEDAELKSWLQKHIQDPTKAFCPICQIALMAKHSTLVSHAKSGGHIANLKARKTNVMETKSKIAHNEDSFPKIHHSSICVKECNNPPEISNKNSPKKTIKSLTSNSKLKQTLHLPINNLMKTKPPVKEKWDTTCLVDLSNQKQCITARKNCPYCGQEQSQSNIARHIQQYCPMKNHKGEVKNGHCAPDKKQMVGLNVSLSDAFKQPLPKKMPTKQISKDVNQKRKMVKRLKSKLKKRNNQVKNVSKADSENTDLKIILGDKNRKRRDGSVSSSCSSSNSSTIGKGCEKPNIKNKALNKLIIKQCKKEKKSLNPVQKEILRRPMMCHLCNFTYSYEDETINRNEIRAKLIEHFELDHVGKDANKDTTNVSIDFNCDFCPYSTPFQMMLNSHIIVQHPGKDITTGCFE